LEPAASTGGTTTGNHAGGREVRWATKSSSITRPYIKKAVNAEKKNGTPAHVSPEPKKTRRNERKKKALITFRSPSSLSTTKAGGHQKKKPGLKRKSHITGRNPIPKREIHLNGNIKTSKKIKPLAIFR